MKEKKSRKTDKKDYLHSLSYYKYLWTKCVISGYKKKNIPRRGIATMQKLIKNAIDNNYREKKKVKMETRGLLWTSQGHSGMIQRQ